jgi:hypothetical protein
MLEGAEFGPGVDFTVAGIWVSGSFEFSGVMGWAVGGRRTLPLASNKVYMAYMLMASCLSSCD